MNRSPTVAAPCIGIVGFDGSSATIAISSAAIASGILFDDEWLLATDFRVSHLLAILALDTAVISRKRAISRDMAVGIAIAADVDMLVHALGSFVTLLATVSTSP